VSSQCVVSMFHVSMSHVSICRLHVSYLDLSYQCVMSHCVISKFHLSMCHLDVSSQCVMSPRVMSQHVTSQCVVSRFVSQCVMPRCVISMCHVSRCHVSARDISACHISLCISMCPVLTWLIAPLTVARLVGHIMVYGVATISRLLKIIGLFCKRALQKRRYSAKAPYNFEESTHRSHPIAHYSVGQHRRAVSLNAFLHLVLPCLLYSIVLS